jgi:hypothetical protein
MTDRNELIEAVRYGEMSIEEGEASAKEAGLDPLETMPAGERYDPRNRTYWTLTEALAWAQSRDFDVVREFGEAWRNDRVIFVGSDSVLSDGRNIVFEYTRLGSASLIDLVANGVRIDACFDALKRAAETGNIEATGIPSTGERVEIKPMQWPDLEIFDDEKSIYLATNPIGGKIFENVLIKANGLIAAFPAGDAVRPAKTCLTIAEIETFLKNKFSDKLPSRDKCFYAVREVYPGTLRKMVDPVHEKLTGGREKGRPKKLPK